MEYSLASLAKTREGVGNVLVSAEGFESLKGSIRSMVTSRAGHDPPPTGSVSTFNSPAPFRGRRPTMTKSFGRRSFLATSPVASALEDAPEEEEDQEDTAPKRPPPAPPRRPVSFHHSSLQSPVA
jgi:hypothetical protein